MTGFHSFNDWKIFHYVYTIYSLSIHSLMDSGWFHILAFVNSPEVKMGVQITLWYADFLSFEYLLHRRIGGLYRISEHFRYTRVADPSRNLCWGCACGTERIGKSRLAGPEWGRDVDRKGCRWFLLQKQCKVQAGKKFATYVIKNYLMCKELFQINEEDAQFISKLLF